VPGTVVRDLWIYLDSDVAMRSLRHVAKIVSSCFAVPCQLRSIRRSVSRAVLQSLVSSLILPRLDYGNARLAGIPPVGQCLDPSSRHCCVCLSVCLSVSMYFIFLYVYLSGESVMKTRQNGVADEPRCPPLDTVHQRGLTVQTRECICIQEQHT